MFAPDRGEVEVVEEGCEVVLCDGEPRELQEVALRLFHVAFV